MAQPGTMRELTEEELILVAAGTSESPSDDGPIIITGTRPYSGTSGYYPGGGGNGGTSPNEVDENGGTGDAPGGETPGDDLEHEQDCTTAAGAADQIRDKIVSTETDGSTLTTSHQKVEYAAFLVKTPDGRFGAAGDMIYSDSSPSYVDLTDNIPADPSAIVGIIHNHAGSPSGDYFTNVMNAYPSGDDWKSMTSLVNTYHLDPNVVSIWVIDAWGNLREFKYSDMAKYTAMDEPQMKDPNNLPPKSEVEGCGSA